MGYQEEMKKIFFLRAGSEINSASFNRLLTIMKAVKIAGFDVELINIRPFSNEKTADLNFTDEYNYVIDGIRSRVIKFKNEVSSNPLLAVYETVRAAKRYMYAEKGSSSVIYLYSVNALDILLTYFISRSLKMKFTTERSEFPETIRNSRSIKAKIYNQFLLPVIYKLFDGIVLMTKTLVRFYSNYLRTDCKILHVPMTVDGERFGSNIEKSNYLAYIGSLNCKKDGLDLLLESVAKRKIS